MYGLDAVSGIFAVDAGDLTIWTSRPAGSGSCHGKEPGGRFAEVLAVRNDARVLSASH